MTNQQSVETLLKAIEENLDPSLQDGWNKALRGQLPEGLDANDLQRLAAFLEEAGKHIESANVSRLASQRRPSSVDIFLHMGSQLVKAQRYGEAEAVLREAYNRLNQAALQVQFQLGVLLTQRSQHQQAYELLGNLYRMNPNHPSIALHYALACGYSLRGPEGMMVLERFLRELKSQPPEQAKGLYVMATCLFSRNAYSDALRCIEEAVRLQPHHKLYSEFLEVINRSRQQAKQKNTQPASSECSEADPSLHVMNFAPVAESGSSVFDKRIPPECREKKSGMKICFLASVDTAGQLTLLEQAMNRYSPHRVRCIVFVHNGLYPLDSNRVDICFNGQDAPPDHPQLLEAMEIVRQADFFHIYENLYNLPGMDMSRYINARNAVWQYCGTSLRLHARQRAEFHMKAGIEMMFNWDSTCARQLGRYFYHIQPFILDFDALPECKPPQSPIRVSHAPMNRSVKGTEFFVEAMNELTKKYDAETVIIEKKSTAECIEIKSTCHMLFDQITQIGLNAVEAMAMGQPAIGMISSFMRMIQFDTPVVSATPETLKDVLERLISDGELREKIGRRSKEWAWRNYAPQRRVRDYGLVYDYIRHGDRPFEQFAEGWDPEILHWGEEDMSYIYTHR